MKTRTPIAWSICFLMACSTATPKKPLTPEGPEQVATANPGTNVPQAQAPVAPTAQAKLPAPSKATPLTPAPASPPAETPAAGDPKTAAASSPATEPKPSVVPKTAEAPTGSAAPTPSGPIPAAPTAELPSTPVVATQPTEAAENSLVRTLSLSHEAAAMRFKQVSHISYRLWFGLDADGKEFQGKAVVSFDLKPKASDLGHPILLDLEEGTLSELKINGTAVKDFSEPGRFDGHHILLKLSELKPTTNQIEISYSHPYSTNGNGLHRFKDPVDAKVYLYTDFEPYNAHRMFPCFDQPDLKASFEVLVEAPQDWQVISNTPHKEVTSKNARKKWTFPPSTVFSTYVFALHAGPYAVWKSNANEIPLRLFARKSLSPYIEHEEWFKVTKEGLDYFSTQFGFPYPFFKYDQIIVPDFNQGAMENVGAVTFSERYVYRTRVTQDKRRFRADTILHEMAHMWFGDLVTMKWWNGLWLNESFATFMAAQAVEKATSFSGSWEAFFSGMKQWAYWEDQLVTTHPIELPVRDTGQAEANFDGITYGKGAASLKQLSFLLGEDDFREGLQRYFQKYAFRNTTLGDFVRMLSEASSKDLSRWHRTWLQTSGVNQVKAAWECVNDPETEKSLISKFELIQTDASQSQVVPDHPAELRTHRTQVALFEQSKRQAGGGIPVVPSKVLDVTYSSSRTHVSEAIGKSCPDFVFPNYKDYDYVKVELDPVSLKFVAKNLAQIADPLTRQMIWHILWEMVTDGKIRAQDYATIALKNSGGEKNTQVLARIFRNLVSPSSNHPSAQKYLTGDLRTHFRNQFEPLIRNRLQSAAGGTDLQLVWYQAFLDIASSPASIQYSRSLLQGKQKLKGLEMDQVRRWEIIQVLARNGAKDAKELIEAELKKDPTDMGEKSAIAAQTMIPDTANKEQWLSQIVRSTGSLPLAKLREAMHNYHLIGQEESTKASIDTYFDTLTKLALSPSSENDEYSKWIASSMFPALCNSYITQRTSRFIDQTPQLSTSVARSLKQAQQEEERCIRAREKASDPSAKDLIEHHVPKPQGSALSAL